MEVNLDDLSQAETTIQHQRVMNLSVAQTYVYLPWQSPELPAATLGYAFVRCADRMGGRETQGVTTETHSMLTSP